jgi:hypothetical protein
MKLEDYKQEYQDFSSLASAAARQLAFAGIATAWFFKTDQSPPGIVPGVLLWSVAAFGFALFSDLMQYIAGAVIYRCIFYSLEKRLQPGDDKDKDFKHSPVWPGVLGVFFLLKVACVLCGYVCLGTYVVPRLL